MAHVAISLIANQLQGGGSSRTIVDTGTTTGGNYKIVVTETTPKTFNAQQIAPITSNPIWDPYYSIWTENWYYNALNVNGILPEIGYPNSEQNAEIQASKATYSPFKSNEDFTFQIGTSGELTIYPYYYGTPDVHVLGLYFIGENGYPLDADGNEITTIDSSTKDKIKKYPIYIDAQNDDIKINPRPVYNIKSVNCDVTKITMQPGDSFDFSPYVTVNGYDKNGNYQVFTAEDLSGYDYTTRLAYVFDTYGYNLSYDPYYHSYTETGTCSTKGVFSASYGKTGDNELTIAAIGAVSDNNDVYRMQTHDEAKAKKASVYMDVETDAKREFYVNSLPTTSFYASCYDVSFFDSYKDNDGKYTFYDDSKQSYNDNSDFQTAVDAFISAYNNYTSGSDDIIGEDHIKSYLTIDNIDWTCFYHQALDPSEWTITLDKSGTICSDEYYAQIGLNFTPKNSNASAPKRNKASRANPYNWQDYLNYQETPGWIDINNTYEPYYQEEESASYYTTYPMLVKSTGYKVTLTKNSQPYTGKVGMYIDVLKSGYAYDSGTYAEILSDKRNESVTVWVDGSQVTKTNTNKYYEHTFFSEKSLNRYTYNTSTTLLAQKTQANAISSRAAGDVDFDYTYAYAFTHPTTGSQFFSFEDWYIQRPSQYDVSVDGAYTGTAYDTNGYYYDDFNDGAGEYNSDRDGNDLIFMLDTSDVEVVSSERTEVVDVDNVGFSWLWAIEDLGSTDDFDFNDVIIRIQSITTNRTTYTYEDDGTGETLKDTSDPITIYKKVQLTPFAAGGTLPIYIHYNDGTNNYTLAPGTHDLTKSGTSFSGLEFHEWFGAGTSSDQMINTKNNTAYKTINVDEMSCTLLLNDKFSIAWNSDATYETAQNMGDAFYQNSFYVTVKTDSNVSEMLNIDVDKAQETEGYLIGPSYKGGAPQSFILLEISEGKNKSEWKWPVERMHITTVYPDFGHWVGDKTNTEYAKWYESTSSEAVCTRVKSSTSNTYTIQ